MLAPRLMIGGLSLCLAVPTGYWLYRAIGVAHAEYTELTQPIADAHPAPHDVREVHWTLGDGTRQRALYLASRNGAAILYAHGSPGVGAGLLPVARMLEDSGYGALLLDLPSYGASEGERTWGPRFRESLVAGVEFLAAQPEVDSQRIGGFGYSMGTSALAVTAAHEPRLRALCLEAAFTTIEQQLLYQFRSRIPGLGRVAVWTAGAVGLALGDLNSLAAMPALTGRPLLLIGGADDQAVAPWMLKQLQAAVPGAELWIVPAAGHVGVADVAGLEYSRRLRGFFDRAIPARQRRTGASPRGIE